MKKVLGSAALALLASIAVAGGGTLTESATLYGTPGASPLGGLPANILVEVIGRESGWYRIKLTDGRTGYVRLRQVRFSEEQASESVFGGLWSWLNSSRRGQGEMSSATAGIRGFDEEQLQDAVPDYEAVDSLTGYASGADGARHFAQTLPLKPRSLDDLPEE